MRDFDLDRWPIFATYIITYSIYYNTIIFKRLLIYCGDIIIYMTIYIYIYLIATKPDCFVAQYNYYFSENIYLYQPIQAYPIAQDKF